MTRVQGACWTTGARFAPGGKRGPRSVRWPRPSHENAAVERREARVLRAWHPTRLASVCRASQARRAKARAPVGAPPPSQFLRGTMRESRALRAAADAGACPSHNQEKPMFQTKVTFAPDQTPEQRKAHAAHWRREDARRRAINNGLGFWRVCSKPPAGETAPARATCTPASRGTGRRCRRSGRNICAAASMAARDGDLSKDAIHRAGLAARDKYLDESGSTGTTTPLRGRSTRSSRLAETTPVARCPDQAAVRLGSLSRVMAGHAVANSVPGRPEQRTGRCSAIAGSRRSTPAPALCFSTFDRRRVLQPENAPRVVVEQLLLVGLRQLDVRPAA